MKELIKNTSENKGNTKEIKEKKEIGKHTL